MENIIDTYYLKSKKNSVQDVTIIQFLVKNRFNTSIHDTSFETRNILLTIYK